MPILPVSIQYPELMHYTTAEGLKGIVSSGCLWATHAACLNDAVEVTHFFDVRLPNIAFPEVRKYIVTRAQDSKADAAYIEARGGIEEEARSFTTRLIDKMRSTTLTMNEPYIFSMSAPMDIRVSVDGLLSQWRAYGGNEGCALVFDTVKLERFLMDESATFHYSLAALDTVYYHETLPIHQLSSTHFAELDEVVKLGFRKLIPNESPEPYPEFYETISRLSCLYKHWSFSEEHEVRVIAIPFNAEPKPGVKLKPNPGNENKLAKPIKTFVRGSLLVPYLELFNKPDLTEARTRLPIKKVIIGPHKDAALRAQGIKQLLVANGYDIEVACSNIPYIGR
jgi:Protein of unknown function (DUF2971)